jgi:F-type H+-transporting ATPase subunit b|tara:strand:- start:353 stop:859 length:507 start_codon:yes stop_codon:yes gene_type:complete
MEAIGINIPGLISQFINFGVFLFLLTVFLYKPVIKVLDQRAEKIKESLDQAEKAREESAKSGEEVQKALAESRDRAQIIVQQAQELSKKIGDDSKAEARIEAEALIDRARSDIQRERDEAIDKVRKEFADLAIVAAEKVISSSLDDKKHRSLVEEVLRETESHETGTK